MSHYLIRQIGEIPNIEVRLDTEVIAVDGDDHLEALTICDDATATRGDGQGRLPVRVHRRRTAHRVARRRGGPRPAGFVLTGPDLLVDGRRPRGWHLDRDPYFLEASVPGVFAAGDVRANSVKRVASAVGEGAMAIQLIHSYLEHQ